MRPPTNDEPRRGGARDATDCGLGGQYSALCADCRIRYRPARQWHTRCRQCYAWHRAASSTRAAMRALERRRISRMPDVAGLSVGVHRMACPNCVKGKRDTALKVTVTAESAVWKCFRCDMAGAQRFGGAALNAQEHAPRLLLPLHGISRSQRIGARSCAISSLFGARSPSSIYVLAAVLSLR